MKIADFMKIRYFRGRSQTAVLLIDMQISFLEALSIEAARKLVTAQKNILAYCEEKRIPVIVIEYDGKTLTLPELIHGASNAFHLKKCHDDAFKKTNLEWLLKKLGVRSLFLMGIYAASCVLQTAQTSIQKGFEVRTSMDVCDHPQGYRTWYHKNGRVAGTAEEAIKQFLTPP